MTQDRWNYIKNLNPSAPRVVWESSKKGTMDVGRNANKRVDRAADVARRVAARASR